MNKISNLTSKLNNNISKIALVAALSAISSANAETKAFDGTYVGIDAIYSNMKFKQNYGENIFSKKWTPGLNLFVGHMFNENWGAEVGYEAEKKMKSSNTAIAGEQLAGTKVPTNMIDLSFDSIIKQRHPYAGIIGKYKLFDNIFVSLMLGGSLSHISARYTYTASQSGPGPVGTVRNYSKTRLIPLVKGIVEYKFPNQLGIRGVLAWKNTSAIKMHCKESNNLIIKAKDTINFGIGVSYYI